jgi:hypothetical protein
VLDVPAESADDSLRELDPESVLTAMSLDPKPCATVTSRSNDANASRR